MTRIDAHHHFWEADRRDLDWLTAGRGPLAHSYGPATLRQELQGTGTRGTVLVQASNTEPETQRVLRAAAETEYVAGAVVWAPLHDSGETQKTLDRYRAHPKFRGVRHVTTGGTDPEWLLHEGVLASLRRVAAAGATFDVVTVSSVQLRALVSLAERIPGLDIVIDHLGRPPIEQQDWQPWAALMREAAAHPRVHVKLSVGLDVLDRGWQWSTDRIRPYAEHALACFGPERVMAASNWPVCLMAATYRQVWYTSGALTAALDDGGRAAVLGGTATTFYKLAEEKEGR